MQSLYLQMRVRTCVFISAGRGGAGAHNRHKHWWGPSKKRIAMNTKCDYWMTYQIPIVAVSDIPN